VIGYLVLSTRCLLCAVLLVSVSTKLLDFPAFLDWVRRLTVVPERRVPTVGVLMTVAETATLVLLIVPAWLAGLVSAAVTMSFFAGSAVFLVRRGIAVPCRCFGEATAPMGVVEIVRNTLLTAVATAAAAVTVLDPQPTPPAPAIILAILLGGAIGLVITRLDDLRLMFAQ
jgi:hypothetical protein